jgi:hypothetical protein
MSAVAAARTTRVRAGGRRAGGGRTSRPGQRSPQTPACQAGRTPAVWTAVVPEAADGQSTDGSGSLQPPPPFVKAGPAGGRLRRRLQVRGPRVARRRRASSCAAGGHGGAAQESESSRRSSTSFMSTPMARPPIGGTSGRTRQPSTICLRRAPRPPRLARRLSVARQRVCVARTGLPLASTGSGPGTLVRVRADRGSSRGRGNR